jgi:ABC-type transport system involved in multi-copper enzyme maturation permease subunit
MTTTLEKTAPVTAKHRPAPSNLKVSQARVVHSEWIKFRSLRSTLITMAAGTAAVIGLGLLSAAFASGTLSSPNRGGPPTSADPTAISLSGVMLAQLIIGSLGVMMTAGEYTTGMIRSSLAAVPKRLPVLWGKATVFAGVTFALMLVASLIAFLGGQAILSGAGAPSASLGDAGVLRAITGAALNLTGVGLMGVALGALLRSTAGAISTLFGLVLILPGLLSLLPSSWNANISPYLPSSAIRAFTTIHAQAGSTALSPGAGIAVFAGWVVVLLAGAAVLLKRRDA